MLVVLALIWGSSFMFIKVARARARPGHARLRRGSASRRSSLAVVVGFSLGARPMVTELRANWLPLVVVGLVNTAVPFWLLSWGETRIDSGLASIIQASVPIFNVVLAFAFFREQRVVGAQLVGVVVGFVGVALLVGAQPAARSSARSQSSGWPPATPRRTCSTRSYLGGTKPAGRRARDDRSRRSLPSRRSGSRAARGLRSERRGDCVDRRARHSSAPAFAYLLFFAIIAGAGAAYASFVTYLVPPIALAYGAIFLDESIGLARSDGLVLILAGVALGTRGGSMRRLRAAPPRFASASSEPS